jgi:hypothetical protein
VVRRGEAAAQVEQQELAEPQRRQLLAGRRCCGAATKRRRRRRIERFAAVSKVAAEQGRRQGRGRQGQRHAGWVEEQSGERGGGRRPA